MSYREKLEKYKKNQLPEEEKKKVEDEIEKAEAINEYLADKLEEELIEDDEAFQDGNEENTFREEKDSRMEEKEAQFEEYVKKSIHRIFRKISVGTGAVLFVALLFVQFGLSPLVSLFYYNPAKQIKVKMESDGDSESWESSESQFGMILESFRTYDAVQEYRFCSGGFSGIWKLLFSDQSNHRIWDANRQGIADSNQKRKNASVYSRVFSVCTGQLFYMHMDWTELKISGSR